MPKIYDTPPQYIADEINKLRIRLDTTIPGKQDDNILIATWNIRAFGKLTSKWVAEPKDSPKRVFAFLTLYYRNN
ncbi:hypothetical protein SAMN06265379_101510 [Saccharicrinis carchari]|uniref:Endonuclease/Exonuclease/phosphatase family protein n=1 Tax=Saccharicrinis carchari TaxID=1168039 RepID=A0A521AXJ5_SACCC|nr:hypothetical protein [Saccharicrinis carchari]SMO39524.1 hypothetical protein SAMN06265379_101510 [Saccharicrinis carchari]